MNNLKILPARALRGVVKLPGDKSISHRAAMLSALAHGVTTISNFASSADCRSTLQVLRAVGMVVEINGPTVRIKGRGADGFSSPQLPLDCGNSGTTMRLFAGMASGLGVGCTLTGDESLSRRPMRRIIEPLTKMGAEIASTDGHAPLVITGGRKLIAINYVTPVASAQIKSAILFAGLSAEGTTTVIENAATRDHTERMLRHFGVEVTESIGSDGRSITIAGQARLRAADMTVPADISAAAFFAVATAALAGSEISMPGVGLNPSRTAVLDVLRQCGAEIKVNNRREAANEPICDLVVSGSEELKKSDPKFVVRGAMVANLIDEIPILAVLGTQVDGGLEFRDASELRVKESDRIAAVAANLKLMGAEVKEFPDGLRVGRSKLRGAAVDSYHDHRIAMAFAVAGLLAEGETTIIDHECVDVSFPGFFQTLESVVVR